MDLSEAAKLMDNIDYLKERRKANQEWLSDFRKRYGIIPEQRRCEHLTPTEWLESHAHHASYGECAH